MMEARTEAGIKTEPLHQLRMMNVERRPNSVSIPVNTIDLPTSHETHSMKAWREWTTNTNRQNKLTAGTHGMNMVKAKRKRNSVFMPVNINDVPTTPKGRSDEGVTRLTEVRGPSELQHGMEDGRQQNEKLLLTNRQSDLAIHCRLCKVAPMAHLTQPSWPCFNGTSSSFSEVPKMLPLTRQCCTWRANTPAAWLQTSLKWTRNSASSLMGKAVNSAVSVKFPCMWQDTPTSTTSVGRSSDVDTQHHPSSSNTMMPRRNT